MSYADRVSTLQAILVAARISEDAAISLAIEAGILDANDYEGGPNGTYDEAVEELAEDWPEEFGDDDDDDEEN